MYLQFVQMRNCLKLYSLPTFTTKQKRDKHIRNRTIYTNPDSFNSVYTRAQPMHNVLHKYMVASKFFTIYKTFAGHIIFRLYFICICRVTASIQLKLSSCGRTIFFHVGA